MDLAEKTVPTSGSGAMQTLSVVHMKMSGLSFELIDRRYHAKRHFAICVA